MVVPGLPRPLVGHIIPYLAIASLYGISPLCNAGCIVVFHKDKVDVWYDRKIILVGPRNMSTDLWTLPFMDHTCDTRIPAAMPQQDVLTHPAIALFMHSVRTRMNAVQFAHQSLGDPQFSTLLKAVRRGFLNGCPNTSSKLILKYLSPSPATAKGHMKRPRHGICSTTPKGVPPVLPAINAAPRLLAKDTPIVLAQPPLSIASSHEDDVWNVPLIPNHIPHPNVILDEKLDPSVANIFAFGAFTDKNSGIVYHDLTGLFPFVSFDGSICFFVLYHYESNCIFADPITALDDKTIFEAYRKQFNDLTKKGFKPKLNVMNNQATKYIKQFLDKNECKLQLVEPHNHCVNAAERAIQMFKDAFIAALATTDADFPIQLWDQLTPQIQNTLNMMRASRMNLAILVYESLNGPYDWNRYPLAPLGCKAVIYEDDNTRGS